MNQDFHLSLANISHKRINVIILGDLRFYSRLYETFVVLNASETNTMSAPWLIDIYDVIVRMETDLARTITEH